MTSESIPVRPTNSQPQIKCAMRPAASAKPKSSIQPPAPESHHPGCRSSAIFRVQHLIMADFQRAEAFAADLSIMSLLRGMSRHFDIDAAQQCAVPRQNADRSAYQLPAAAAHLRNGSSATPMVRV
jgi:hypothetical protein